MLRFDYSYYKNVFGGKLDEDAFESAANVSVDVISELIGSDPRHSGDEAILRALCHQTETAASASRERIRKESLGDYSVTYAEESMVTIGGIPVSSEAVLALGSSGRLTRWV